MLGFIALIVPGIVLLVRYAVLDSAVVLEGANSAVSRRRSAELTSGKRWQIFAAALLFFFAFLMMSILVYVPVGFFPAADTMVVNVLLDCCLDVAYSVIQIVMFLYYWEAAHQEDLPSDPSGVL